MTTAGRHAGAFRPREEAARLEDLRSYRILDTPAEADFDDITLLASSICQTPIALITLIDEDRQWFKSRVGTEITETARDVAFCAHAILQPDMFVVHDALADQRFANNPLVKGAGIRFYAGVPLINANGHALGTLCTIDRVPRDLTDDQEKALAALSRQVVALLEARRTRLACDRMMAASERLCPDCRRNLGSEFREV
jgi:GAF domain-containing protein